MNETMEWIKQHKIKIVTVIATILSLLGLEFADGTISDIIDIVLKLIEIGV